MRDSAFASILRQEVAWFDVHPPAVLSSQLAEDAALLHAFVGEPIRTLALSLSSVLVGLIVSFYFMWQFALLTMATIPFMAFGAEMEMRMYLGEDEGDEVVDDKDSPGGIIIEALSNMRTVASLCLEERRAQAFARATDHRMPSMLSNLVKGSGAGAGQFCQMFGMALMFWWGGWLLDRFPDRYSFRDYLISTFSLLFGLYGIALASQGAVDRKKASRAAARIFAVTDRESHIDPLSDKGETI